MYVYELLLVRIVTHTGGLPCHICVSSRAVQPPNPTVSSPLCFFITKKKRKFLVFLAGKLSLISNPIFFVFFH